MDLKAFISQRGMSIKQLADAMGSSAPALHQVLTGNPTAQKLQDIATAIGCKRWQLFADEMEIADVIEYFKDDMQAEIDRRIAEAVEAKEKEMTEQAETQAKEYEQRISELQHQLDTREPSRQGALVCPNCGRPFVIKVIATASTE
jgi:transcriptional regulator with XRE-family HTH domain